MTNNMKKLINEASTQRLMSDVVFLTKQVANRDKTIALLKEILGLKPGEEIYETKM